MKFFRLIPAGLATAMLLIVGGALIRMRDGPRTAGGWIKYDRNPVLGGTLGTCFDASVMKDGDRFRMWFSWRPRQSIAVTESQDGINWTMPAVAVAPKPHAVELRVNRPVVLKRDGLYQMWFTSQSQSRSWIGRAVSKDGIRWRRAPDRAVLSATLPWEKAAVMCPHVLWDEQAGLYKMWYWSYMRHYRPFR